MDRTCDPCRVKACGGLKPPCRSLSRPPRRAAENAYAGLQIAPELHRPPALSFSMPTVHAYYLQPPAWKPNAKPYQSAWKMTREEAAARGLTDKDIVPGTTEERRDLGLQSAGRDGPKM